MSKELLMVRSMVKITKNILMEMLIMEDNLDTVIMTMALTQEYSKETLLTVQPHIDQVK